MDLLNSFVGRVRKKRKLYLVFGGDWVDWEVDFIGKLFRGKGKFLGRGFFFRNLFRDF
jgi:hypothetical protein